MFYEGIYPCRLGRRRAAYAEPAIRLLDCGRCVIVKLPISWLFRVASPEIDVGLIPDFEVPVCDLVDAISLDQMPSKSRNELVPFVPILWR